MISRFRLGAITQAYEPYTSMSTNMDCAKSIHIFRGNHYDELNTGGSNYTSPDMTTPVDTIAPSAQSFYYTKCLKIFGSYLATAEEETEWDETSKSFWVEQGVPHVFYLYGATTLGLRNLYCNYIALCYDE